MERGPVSVCRRSFLRLPRLAIAHDSQKRCESDIDASTFVNETEVLNLIVENPSPLDRALCMLAYGETISTIASKLFREEGGDVKWRKILLSVFAVSDISRHLRQNDAGLIKAIITRQLRTCQRKLGRVADLAGSSGIR